MQAAIKVLDMTYVTSACLMRLAECGSITHTSSASVDYSPSDSWLAATSDVQLVLTDSWGTGSTGTVRDIDVDASFDMGLLNRGEWIKFVSLFFNAEEAANAVFNSLSTTLTAATFAGTALESAAGTSPKVAFVAWSSWSKSWVMSNATYKAEYVDQAGGVLAAMPAPTAGVVSYSSYDNTAANYVDVGALKTALRSVNVLIDETVVYPGSPETYTFASFLTTFNFTAADVTSGLYPFLTANAVYREDKTMNDGQYGSFGLDWFANGISQPQLVLNDFIAALFPTSTFAKAYTTRWLRNLGKNEPFAVVESSQCADPTIAPICGGPTAYLTVPNLQPANFTAAALQAAVLALLPSSTTAQVVVTDFPVSAVLSLHGPTSVALPQGTPAFLGALGSVLGYPVSTPGASSGLANGRRLLASSLQVPITVDSFGSRGAPAATAMLTLLNNASAVLAAVRAAGAAGVTNSSASDVQVAATVTVTVAGTNAVGAMSSLQAAVNAGQLNSALVSAGLAAPAPPSGAVGLQAHVYALLMLAALLF